MFPRRLNRLGLITQNQLFNQISNRQVPKDIESRLTCHSQLPKICSWLLNVMIISNKPIIMYDWYCVNQKTLLKTHNYTDEQLEDYDQQKYCECHHSSGYSYQQSMKKADNYLNRYIISDVCTRYQGLENLFTDAELEVKSDDYSIKFNVHRVILASISPMLKAMFTNNMKDQGNYLLNWDPKIFRCWLDILYGKICREDLAFNRTLEIFRLEQYLGIDNDEYLYNLRLENVDSDDFILYIQLMLNTTKLARQAIIMERCKNLDFDWPVSEFPYKQDLQEFAKYHPDETNKLKIWLFN